jgi:hypothetical protein
MTNDEAIKSAIVYLETGAPKSALDVLKSVHLGSSAEPPPCDPEIYEKGECACVVAGPAWLIEAWVVRLREISEQRIDWNYSGGRAVISYIGDGQRVADAIARCPLPTGGQRG